jgi:hypothetical protein
MPALLYSGGDTMRTIPGHQRAEDVGADLKVADLALALLLQQCWLALSGQ